MQLSRRVVLKLGLWHLVGSACFSLGLPLLFLVLALLGMGEPDETIIGGFASGAKEMLQQVVIGTPALLLALLVWSQITHRMPALETRHLLRTVSLGVYGLGWVNVLYAIHTRWTTHTLPRWSDYLSPVALIFTFIFSLSWAVLPRVLIPWLRPPLYE